jgi:hypothetical protein
VIEETSRFVFTPRIKTARSVLLELTAREMVNVWVVVAEVEGLLARRARENVVELAFHLSRNAL